jgi:uncharacterized membrane protein YfcA
VGGAVGALCAVPLVKSISTHLTAMRWLVTVVILYAAVSMLYSAWISSAQEHAPEKIHANQ